MTEAADWVGGSEADASHWLTLAIGGLGPQAAGTPLPPNLVVERGRGARADRALISGPAGALLELASSWYVSNGSTCRAGAAIRQCVEAYLAPAAGPPRLVGVLNVTPDSFSDGGAFANARAAVAHGLALVRSGAHWIDVGGESTRPGAAEVPAVEELRRVLPVVRGLARAAAVPISIDTRKAAVALRCFRAGATILNDVSALTRDPEMARAAAEWDATVILMHMPGTPATMQQHADYEDVVTETIRYLRARAEAAVAAGIRSDRLWVDPGFGFGKTPDQNLAILRRLREYRSIGLPVMIGTSRKSTIGRVLGGLPARERLEGTAATVAAAVLAGVSAVRVHDVAEMARVVKMAWAIVREDVKT
jgi:dihydropteroate synthase